jgi:HTH-type transcriptional regulator/antitoxin HigA
MSTKIQIQALPDRYLQLLQEFPLRPIRDDAEHRRAVEVLDGLIDRGDLTAEEDDYLTVLGLIVGAFEDAVYDHPSYSGVERLRFLMEENGLSQARLAEVAKISPQTLSGILLGKRNISPKIRGALARHFGVPANIFD